MSKINSPTVTLITEFCLHFPFFGINVIFVSHGNNEFVLISLVWWANLVRFSWFFFSIFSLLFFFRVFFFIRKLPFQCALTSKDHWHFVSLFNALSGMIRTCLMCSLSSFVVHQFIVFVFWFSFENLHFSFENSLTYTFVFLLYLVELLVFIENKISLLLF